MNSEKKRDLTEGSVPKKMIKLAFPVMIGFMLHAAYNLIDTFYIGMLGEQQLAAISVTFPVIFIFIAIASGLSIGTTALVSQALGARKLKDADNIAEHSLLLAVIAGIAIAVLGIMFSPYLFEFMGATGQVLDLTMQYATIIFIGVIFLFSGFIGRGIIQADGDTVTPTKYQAIAVGLNIVLDPILIFGLGPFPEMGLVGAAVATVIARSIETGLILAYLFRGKTRISLAPKDFSLDFGIVRRIFNIGIPSSLSQSVNSIGLILMMAFVGGFGTTAIASFGVGIRLESLVILPVIGITAALIPFAGQNLGAGAIKRARDATMFAVGVITAIMIVVGVFFFFIPELIFSPFTTSAEVIATGGQYLRIVALGYVFLGIELVFGGIFQGAGRTDLQLGVNLIRWIFIVLGAFILMNAIGIEGIWWGFPIGNFAAFAVAGIIYKSGVWLKGWKRDSIQEQAA